MNLINKPFISTIRWLPSSMVMVLIYFVSSLPSDSIPRYGIYDLIIKKGLHFTIYGILALAYIYALKANDKKTTLIVLMMIIMYAITDEFHQSFVPGRGPRFSDVIIDTLGGVFGLIINKINPKILSQ